MGKKMQKLLEKRAKTYKIVSKKKGKKRTKKNVRDQKQQIKEKEKAILAKNK